MQILTTRPFPLPSPSLVSLALIAGLLSAPPHAAAQAADQVGSCGDVAIAEFDWPAAEIVTAILAQALSDGYGCAVSRPAASPGPALDAVAAASAADRLLIAPGLRLSDGEDRSGAVASARLYRDGDGAGWFAPAWFLALNPDLKTVEDLARAARAFREAGRGASPRLTICPESWPCHGDNIALIAELGLESVFDIVTPANGAALKASVEGAFAARRPWLGYGWEPSEIAAEYGMRRIALGQAKICDGIDRGAADCRQPFAEPPLVTAYGSAFWRRAPRVAAFLNRFQLESAAMSKTLSWRAANNASADQAAAAFFAANRALWAPWFDKTALQAFEAAAATRE